MEETNDKFKKSCLNEVIQNSEPYTNFHDGYCLDKTDKDDDDSVVEKYNEEFLGDDTEGQKRDINVEMEKAQHFLFQRISFFRYILLIF